MPPDDPTVQSAYEHARQHLIANPDVLIALERRVRDDLVGLYQSDINNVVSDFDAASHLYPFWRDSPPEPRGRAPIGDQYPWIEVGEHAIGGKLGTYLRSRYSVRDLGFPTGPDQRFLITHEDIGVITGGLTESAWVLIDIKSVGPRDDQAHTVMSTNQISGSGEWNLTTGAVENEPMMAVGARASHRFYPALPPLIITDTGDVAPTLTFALKPVYAMTGGPTLAEWTGQPLDRLDLATLPNGLLLTRNPNYLERHPGLIFPGKDDKSKDERKLRARISFELLAKIAAWRVATIFP